MSIRDLIPRTRDNNHVPAAWGEGEQNPFFSLRREMNRLFEDAFRDFDMRMPMTGQFTSSGMGWPSVEISETEKEFRVSAEIPGLEQKDIEVLLDDGVLTLRGEKRAETNDRDRQFSERYYGRFERRIPLGNVVEEEKIDASFKNGIL